MKLPNWVKIVYWLALTALVSWLLFDRLDVTAAGNATPFDAVVFVVWVALVLAPIFSEIKIWGISLKQEFEKVRKETEDAKQELLREVQTIRMDVRNSIQVSPVFHQTVPAPPSDSQLPQIRAEIDRALDERSSHSQAIAHDLPAVPKNVSYLFSVRYEIEQQIRRICSAFLDDQRLRTQLRAQVRFLEQQQAISHLLGEAITDVYRICSPAVHGDKVTEDQVAFVADVAPKLLATLSDIPPLLPD